MAGPQPETVPLCQLRVGDRARLAATDLACEDCDLLRAMGLTDQCVLRVCRHGEPCIVEVANTRLGLSTAMTKRIYVTVEVTAESSG